jgi:ABC-2 type transport system permease protein
MKQILAAFWHNMRIFFRGAYLSYIALFAWLRPVTYMASKVIMPLNQMLFFTFLGISATGRDSASFYIIGNAIQIAAVSGIYGVTFSVGGERWTGTLGYLFGTPANRMFLFLGRAFFHIIDGMLGVVLAFIWGIVLLGLDLSNTDLLALGLTIVVTTVSTSGLGLLMGCLSLITRNIMFVNNTVYFLLLVLSGANIPLDVLPGSMRTLSYALPLTRGIQAARTLIDGGAFSQISADLLGELMIGLFYASVGYLLFRWFEIQAKRIGSLEVF